MSAGPTAARFDQLERCPWCGSAADYMAYHDTEWGVPIVDERLLFERLSLEGFQSGLSWLTILRRREGLRRAFHGFDPHRVAAMAAPDVERLLGDASIIRHRGKIEATIDNAQALLQLHAHGATLAEWFWAAAPPSVRVDSGGAGPRTLADVPTKTTESAALSKRLRQAGFRFVAATTIYAAMQAAGVVNDHLQACFRRRECEALRGKVRIPGRSD